jgi:hypothetical protein
LSEHAAQPFIAADLRQLRWLGRLNSNYKGFLVSQAKRLPDGPLRGPFLHLHSFQDLQPSRRRALAKTTRCGLAKLQTVIRVAFNATDPDEGRTRGTHSLAGKPVAALELIGHAPRRPKPVVINSCRHTAVVSVFLGFCGGG